MNLTFLPEETPTIFKDVSAARLTALKCIVNASLKERFVTKDANVWDVATLVHF